MSPNPPPDVAAAFADLPDDHLESLLTLRSLILDVAEKVGAAPVNETLKWGQPNYLSARPRESTATRLGSTKDLEYFGLFFHCESTVIPEFEGLFPNDFRYDGTRAILFRPGDDLQTEKLRLCIAHALRYQVPAKRGSSRAQQRR